MKKIILLLIISFPSSVLGFGWESEYIETHIGFGPSVYAPIHCRTIGYGYNLSLVMRPSYARYLFDELEKLNLGISIQSSNQYINDENAYRDVCFSIRHYFNHELEVKAWQSGFIGVGIGLATVYLNTETLSVKKRDKDFIIEAGYEMDLFDGKKWCPLVLMFAVNWRMIDIEPVSYTGTGFSLSLCYGVSE